MGVSFTDVTRYRRVRDELAHANTELERAYEELQSLNEELETTNEELQSTIEELETTNEELQSTNEELETMNEELQSTNDELQVINDELRGRSEELDQANSFFGSVLRLPRQRRDRTQRRPAGPGLVARSDGPVGSCARKRPRRKDLLVPRHRPARRVNRSLGAQGPRRRVGGRHGCRLSSLPDRGEPARQNG